MSRIFFLLAFVFAFLGVLFWIFEQIGVHLFRLPGDIVIRKGNFVFFFPIVTSLILSLIFTLIINIFFRR